MNISGVVVRTLPEKIHAVEDILLNMEGVEVHGHNDDGRMVVTIEQENTRESSDVILQMQNVPGVLSTMMIYHQFEDEHADDS